MRRPAGRRAGLEYLNLRVIGGAVVFACFLLLASTLALLLTRRPRGQPAPATAILTVIALDTPTGTPAAVGSGTPGPGAETQLPTPLPGVISRGAFVQIVGTGGDGLRLRDQAGLDGKVVILGSESEVFRIEDGPKDADGFTWWFLVGPFNSNRRGWAVTNYLQVVQGP